MYGEQARFFQDEIRQDLKHKKKGMVAMASASGPLILITHGLSEVFCMHCDPHAFATHSTHLYISSFLPLQYLS